MNKKNFSTIFLLFLLGATIWFCWDMMFPSETRQITKRLNKLAKTVSFSKGTSDLVKVATNELIREYFSTNVVIELKNIHPQGENITDSGILMNLIALARTYLEDLNIQFEDPVIELSLDKTHAIMEVMVRISINEFGDGHIYQLMQINWIKTDKKWKIEYVRTLKLLGRENIPHLL